MFLCSSLLQTKASKVTFSVYNLCCSRGKRPSIISLFWPQASFNLYIENPHYKNPQDNVKSLDGESFLRVLTSRPQHYVGFSTDTDFPIWLDIIFAHLGILSFQYQQFWLNYYISFFSLWIKVSAKLGVLNLYRARNPSRPQTENTGVKWINLNFYYYH